MGERILKPVAWCLSSLHWEKYYPFVLATIAGILTWVSGLTIESDQALLLSTSVTFGAIAAGFVGTSLSILTSLGTKVMQRIRETPYVFVVREYLGWGLCSGIMVCCTGIVGLLLKLYALAWFTTLWCSIVAFCIACLFRLGKIMLKIFSDCENRPTD